MLETLDSSFAALLPLGGVLLDSSFVLVGGRGMDPGVCSASQQFVGVVQNYLMLAAAAVVAFSTVVAVACVAFVVVSTVHAVNVVVVAVVAALVYAAFVAAVEVVVAVTLLFAVVFVGILALLH